MQSTPTEAEIWIHQSVKESEWVINRTHDRSIINNYARTISSEPGHLVTHAVGLLCFEPPMGSLHSYPVPLCWLPQASSGHCYGPTLSSCRLVHGMQAVSAIDRHWNAAWKSSPSQPVLVSAHETLLTMAPRVLHHQSPALNLWLFLLF